MKNLNTKEQTRLRDDEFKELHVYMGKTPVRDLAKRKRRVWVIAGVAVIVFFGVMAILGYYLYARQVVGDGPVVQEHPLYPPGVSLKPTAKPVVGNLGGLPVTFPAGFVDNVEYDGDPGFGEKRVGTKPERTLQSELKSLGFYVRYPKIAVTTWKEREEDRRQYSIYNTPWLSVGITAGPIFGDGLFLERGITWMNHDKEFQYEKSPKKQYDLDVYTPYTVDKSKRNYNPVTRTYPSDLRDRDIYVHYDHIGKMDAYIECNNVNHRAAPCRQFFYLSKDYRVKFYVGYRRGMLSHWKEIQESIIKLVFGFNA